MVLTPSRPNDTDRQATDQRPSPPDDPAMISSSRAGSRFDPYAPPRLSNVTIRRPTTTTTTTAPSASFQTQDMTLLADLEARATELSAMYNTVYMQLRQDMGISGPTGDLINLSAQTPRTGSIPTTTTASINPFDAFTGFPESPTSSDSRFPYPVSGTDTTYPNFDIMTTAPSSIYSGVTLGPYPDGPTPNTIIPAPPSSTRARVDPPTEDPRAVPDPDNSDRTLLMRSSRHSSSTNETMPSLVNNDVVSPVDYPSLTLSAQIAELDLSDAAARLPPTSVDTNDTASAGPRRAVRAAQPDDGPSHLTLGRYAS
jgi:hypothetical protein